MVVVYVMSLVCQGAIPEPASLAPVPSADTSTDQLSAPEHALPLNILEAADALADLLEGHFAVRPTVLAASVSAAGSVFEGTYYYSGHREADEAPVGHPLTSSGPLRIVDNWLLTPVWSSSGTVEVWVPGFEPALITWSDARLDDRVGVLTTVTLSAFMGAVTGHTINCRGKPVEGVRLEGCGGITSTSRDGSYYLELGAADECELAVRWTSGGRTCTHRETITPQHARTLSTGFSISERGACTCSSSRSRIEVPWMADD